MAYPDCPASAVLTKLYRSCSNKDKRPVYSLAVRPRAAVFASLAQPRNFPRLLAPAPPFVFSRSRRAVVARGPLSDHGLVWRRVYAVERLHLQVCHHHAGACVARPCVVGQRRGLLMASKQAGDSISGPLLAGCSLSTQAHKSAVRCLLWNRDKTWLVSVSVVCACVLCARTYCVCVCVCVRACVCVCVCVCVCGVCQKSW